MAMDALVSRSTAMMAVVLIALESVAVTVTESMRDNAEDGLELTSRLETMENDALDHLLALDESIFFLWKESISKIVNKTDRLI
jgi:hypothetical protein